ncbi:hypothetical protein FQR65_LT17132 [Abscondita terminalis]|nr:hypothetical protein FQR65_LT17132 [Abscondita terminalis]
MKNIHVTDVARVNVDVGNNTQGSTTLTSSKSSITSDAESISRIIVTEQQLEEKVSNYLASLKSNPPINVDTGEDDLALHNNQPISNENIRFDQEYTSNTPGLFDALKPEYFNLFILATKNISGYDITMKTFKSPSLALHMGTNLKMVCDVAFKIVIEKKQIPNIKWINKSEKKTEIKELRKLIDNHWCSELSSLALKDMKEKQWNNPIQLPLTSDIKIFNNYLNTSADDAFNDLNALTVMFNRKRIGDVQYLKIESYTTPSKGTTDQEDFINSLTSVEKILCTKFKRVITGGKGSKPVPILFSNKLQKFNEFLERVATSFNVNVQDNRNENDEDGLNKATTSEELADVDSLFYKETEMNSLSLEDEEGEKENPNYPLSLK